MAKEKKHKEEKFHCPVGRFFEDLEGLQGGKSEFFDHLNQSRLEFLKAKGMQIEEHPDIDALRAKVIDLRNMELYKDSRVRGLLVKILDAVK